MAIKLPIREDWQQMTAKERKEYTLTDKEELRRFELGLTSDSEKVREESKEKIMQFIVRDRVEIINRFGMSFLAHVLPRNEYQNDWTIKQAAVYDEAIAEPRELLNSIRRDVRKYTLELDPNLQIEEDASYDNIYKAVETNNPELTKLYTDITAKFLDSSTGVLQMRDALRDEVERRKRAKEKKRESSKLPSTVRQHTFQEVRNLGQAITDGATLQNWMDIPGETALRHKIDGQPIETKLSALTAIDWWDGPATYDKLREELQKLTPEGVLLFQFALESVLLHDHATLGLDDLIKEIGWTPRSRTERDKMRWQIYYWLCLFTNFTSHGTRPGIYNDPITNEKGKIITSSSYFAITDKERLEGHKTPLSVTITASKWIAAHKNDNAVLQHFGNLRKLSGLPTGQPRGEYALCIGLAAFQKWREEATRCETKKDYDKNIETVLYKPFSRFDLLNMFRPSKFPMMDILNSDRPKRAQTYWEEAISELKERKVIGHYKAQNDRNLPRKGWQNAWLHEKNIEIRPTGDERQAAVELSNAARKKRKRFRPAQTTKKI